MACKTVRTALGEYNKINIIFYLGKNPCLFMKFHLYLYKWINYNIERIKIVHNAKSITDIYLLYLFVDQTECKDEK